MTDPRGPGAGALDQRVVVEEDLGVTRSDNDGLNQPVENWRAVGETWASVATLSGREFWQARQTQADVTHRVVMRSSPASRRLTASGRLRWRDGLLYPVEPPRDPDQRGEWVEVLCQEAR